jgi:hypothetical protein
MSFSPISIVRDLADRDQQSLAIERLAKEPIALRHRALPIRDLVTPGDQDDRQGGMCPLSANSDWAELNDRTE